MTFHKIDSPEPVVRIIANKLINHLSAGEKVFWLLTGGSGIPIEVKVSQLIQEHDVSKLIVALMDERYGPIGHPDSNWQQLLDAGFDLPNATLLPILRGGDRAESTEQLNQTLVETFSTADYSLGQFGIGPDGHTAGILPDSPQIDTDELAISYADSEATQQFTPGVYRDKDRITMTAAAIAKLDEAIVVALGKDPALFDRLEHDIPIEQMPAQALKQVKNLSIYNDCKGEIL